jgi:hypothetical protein
MKTTKRQLERALTISLFVVLALSLIPFIFKVGYVESYDTTNITAFVNVTNAVPEILRVDININQSIDLTQGTTFTVGCNATIRDYSGFNDIEKVNATFFLNHNRSLTSANNPNDMYRNTTCFQNVSDTNSTGTFLCTMNVQYFAFNGTWNCTIFVKDFSGKEHNGSNISTINQLFAMNVTQQINYGNLEVFDKSDNQTVNITNWGNQQINLSVFGYGGDDEANGQGLAMVCPFGTNISIDNQRYSIDNLTTDWGSMTPLTNSPVNIINFSLAKQTVTGTLSENATMWTLFVPPNPFGQCNGTVVFEALASYME